MSTINVNEFSSVIFVRYKAIQANLWWSICSNY